MKTANRHVRKSQVGQFISENSPAQDVRIEFAMVGAKRLRKAQLASRVS